MRFSRPLDSVEYIALYGIFVLFNVADFIANALAIGQRMI